MEFTDGLSQDHPLRTDPARWWPYLVVVGYRRGPRQIVKTRSIWVRSCGPANAEHFAIRKCREEGPVVRDRDGKVLRASMAVSVRAMDKHDAIGANQE